MKINEVLLKEKRRNPKHPSQKVKTAYEQLLPYHNEDNIYINFTNISKAGVNPISNFDTPVGIYSYPLKEIWKYIKYQENTLSVPYAGYRSYINILKSNQVMELSNYTHNDLKTDIIKLKTFLKDHNFKDKSILNIIMEGKVEALVKNPGGYLWNITRLISIEIKKNKSQHAWNWIFRNILGYKAISDKKGQGIIHENEKIQAIFFNVTAFKLIGRIRNKVESLRPLFSKYKDINSKSEKEQINILLNYPILFKLIKSPSEEVKEYLVFYFPKYIEYIKNPSEKVQLVAVKKDGMAIWHIKNPSEQAQLAAVKQNWRLINDILKKGIIPSEKVQVAAIISAPSVILNIIEKGITPSARVLFTAIKEDPKLIKILTDKGISIPEPIKIKIVKFNRDAIYWIHNPSEKVQLAAVSQDGYAIQFIENPSEKVQLAAINQNENALNYIKNPSEQVQLTSVNQNGKTLYYIKNPSEKVQLAAVSQNGKAIQYINNPSEKVQLAAINQNRYAIYNIRPESAITDKVKQLAEKLKNENK